MTHHLPPHGGRLDPGVAHQLRSPLNLLILALEMHKRGDAGQQAEAMRLLQRGTSQLSNLINDLCGTTEAAPGRQNSTPVLSRPPAGTRVLVVEDEYLLAQAVSHCLVEAGCVVVGPVATVGDAMAMLDDLQANCAIVDANLDGTFSFPVIQALRHRGIPSAVLSGYDQSALPVDLQDVPFLQKPVISEQLLSLVARLCHVTTQA